MAITHSTVTRNSFCTEVNTRIGTGGYIDITTTGGVLLARILLASPAFAAPVSGIMIANGLPLSGVALATGEATKCYIKNSGNTVIFQGTVSALGGSGDVQLESNVLEVGDTVYILNAEYIAAP